MTREQAHNLLADLSEHLATDILDDPVVRKNAIRRARAAAHPDRHGGDTDLWDQVEAAIAVVDR